MSRKGSELRNSYLFESYRGGIYHAAYKGGRAYLCGCGRECELKDRLKIGFGFRGRMHKPKRNDNFWM